MEKYKNIFTTKLIVTPKVGASIADVKMEVCLLCVSKKMPVEFIFNGVTYSIDTSKILSSFNTSEIL